MHGRRDLTSSSSWQSLLAVRNLRRTSDRTVCFFAQFRATTFFVGSLPAVKFQSACLGEAFGHPVPSWEKTQVPRGRQNSLH